MNFFKIATGILIFNLSLTRLTAQPSDSTEYYRLLDQVSSYYFERQIKPGKKSCDELIRYCIKEYGENSLTTYDAYSFKSLFFKVNNEYLEAEQLMSKVLKDVESRYGKNNMVYANTLSNYADVWGNMGHLLKAIEIGKEILQLDSILGEENSEVHGISLNNMAVKYKELGSSLLALEYLNKALALTSDKYLSFRYLNIAENHINLGNFQEGLRYFEQAQSLFEDQWGPNHIETLNCQVNYCIFRIELGEYDRVIRILSELEQKALQLTDISKNHILHARIQGYLVVAYINAKNYTLAEQYVQKYIATCENLRKENPLLINIAYIQKVQLLEHQNKLIEADRLMTEIMKGTQNTFSFDIRHLLFSQYISTKARIGNYAEAITTQQKLNTEIRDKFGTHNILFIDGTGKLSKLYFQNEEFETSKRLNITLMEGLLTQISSIYPYLSDNGKIHFKEKTGPILDFIHRTLVSHFHSDPEYLTKVNEFLINYSALSFSFSNLKRKENRTDTQQKLFFQWEEVRNNIEKVYSDPSLYSHPLDSLLSRSNELERKLSINNEVHFENISY